MRLTIKENGVGLLTFKAWENIPYLTHCFSTRIGGVSEEEFAAMNLGFNRGDSDENVKENFRLIAQAANIPVENITARRITTRTCAVSR